MDLVIPIYLAIFAILFFLIALFEERDDKSTSQEEEDKATNLIILLMSLAIVLFFIAGVCMMNVTQSYYSPETNTIIETDLPAYRPFGYVFIGLAIIGLILVSQKVLDFLGSMWKEG